jgi:diguanylate cyclase (GGDEF)-like protein/PAS domain S-box-containing protein
MGVSGNSPAVGSKINQAKKLDLASISQKVDLLQSELAELFNATPFGSFSISYEGICLSINHTALTWLGRSLEETVGKPAFKNWLTPVCFEKYERQKNKQTGLDIDNYEIEILNKDGLIRPISLSMKQVGTFKENDTIYRGILIDITEQKRAIERQKIESLAFETAFGVCIADKSGQILHCNQAVTRLTGYDKNSLQNYLNEKIKSQDFKYSRFEEIAKNLLEHEYWEGEIQDQHKDGSTFSGWLSIKSVGKIENESKYYVACLYDLTENRKLQEQLSRYASFDSLTQLPNRRKLEEKLNREISISRRSGLFGAVLFIDLDNFKSINDTKGHAAGDKLLIESGVRLVHSVRNEDMVSRMGGDEFVVLLTDLSSDETRAGYQAKVVVEKILMTLSEPYILDDFEFRCTASVGIAIFGKDETSTDVIDHADLAMYQAKKLGRNRYHFFDLAMQEATINQVFLDQDLRRALGERQLQLYFQPQINNQFEVFSAEALLRWQHPQRGLMTAESFIPLAEETGLILPIGLWVLKNCCTQLKKWENDPLTKNICLAVNINSRQFLEPNFDKLVLECIQESKINPELLILELTESIVHDILDTKKKMQNIGESGVSFSLDDFGTGYSSLSVLTELPIKQLKIDKSFVKSLFVSTPAESVIETIIGMAENLGLSVVAEGVETRDQLNFLRSKGCRNYQGFLFGLPMDLFSFEKFLKEPKTYSLF